MFFKRNLISTDPLKIKEILERGVEDVLVKESLQARLASGKELRIKLGFDPTGSKIHLGRALVLWKLKAFQDLGHKIVFIVGDFTARIGDPSDKLEKRPMLTEQDIQKNLKGYKEQVGKILDLRKVEFCFNSTWLKKMSFNETVNLAESFSVQQMSARRNFKERFDKGEEVSLREFLYPLMQGYDSVVVKSDVEIGGFDQLFNLKAGRTVQKRYGMKEQDVLTTKMLLGTDGRKMSTSWGNVINITDEPGDMFGKVMSIKDELISDYFLLCTNTSLSEIEEIKKQLAQGENPRNIKIVLAFKIVELYYGGSKAEFAQKNFIQTFKKGGVPEDIQTIQVEKDSLFVDVLTNAGFISSKSDFRRLVVEGALAKLPEGRKITDPYGVAEEGDFKIGKRRFVRIVYK
ncbi:MAG: tyrosyl-tRNA synthetase, tyrosyl-tRNA synthetase [Candidatus Parcubacteria bacterium]|jgi:tyrosyl-tRNA synthetase